MLAATAFDRALLVKSSLSLVQSKVGDSVSPVCRHPRPSTMMIAFKVCWVYPRTTQDSRWFTSRKLRVISIQPVNQLTVYAGIVVQLAVWSSGMILP